VDPHLLVKHGDYNVHKQSDVWVWFLIANASIVKTRPLIIMVEEIRKSINKEII